MGLILDTCIFIRAEKQNKPIKFSSDEEEIYISVVTVSELLVGVHRASNEVNRLKRAAFVETIINEIPILNFTEEVARIHAELYSYLASQGQLIGVHDLIIAATAVACGCSILTSNQHEFNRVPGLKVLDLSA